MPNSAVIAAVVVVIIVVISVVIYFATKGGASPAPGPAPAALTPLQTLLATGQTIVDSTEVDVGKAAGWAFTKSPTGVPTSGPVAYTVSFDILVSSAGAAKDVGVWGHPDTSGDRSPAFFLYPSGSNRFHYVHRPQGSGYSTVSTKTYTPGRYAKFTVVADGSSLKTWVDGVADAQVTGTAPMEWSTSPDWIWNGYKNLSSGEVNVKNFYWFPKALSDGEIATLTGVSSGPTTSGYMPEPYSGKGVSGY